MNNTNTIKIHDKGASIYDSQVKDYESHMHEVLFGMYYEYIKQGDNLLDIGIGTGLSSFLFAKNGLAVFGMDASEEMLKECRKKNFTEELKQHSIAEIPLPYADVTYNNIICCGVFHFFSDIAPVIRDVTRILKRKGRYAFSIALLTEKDFEGNNDKLREYIESPTKYGISICRHSDNYIKMILNKNRLGIQKEQKILADSGDKDTGDIIFKIYIVQKS